ncbi:uncharacterized protein BDV17DRAFT_252703 [Aspergillus undulatus]|uniref:uncharacterized protein n=1 Tax=Aspergillus undulatus TaxID=1810928 RepID=UPI003CCE3774
MGKDPITQLRARASRFREMNAKLIYAAHPRHSVCWNAGCMEKRGGLLKCIMDSLSHFGMHDPLVWDNLDANSPSIKWEGDRAQAFGDLIDLLRLMRSLCLPPSCLPELNVSLEDSGYYQLDNEHVEYLHPAKPVSDWRQRRANIVAGPIFMELNRHITPESWFLQRYTVDWDRVWRTINNAISIFDRVGSPLAGVKGKCKAGNSIGTETSSVAIGLQAIRARLDAYMECWPPTTRR